MTDIDLKNLQKALKLTKKYGVTRLKLGTLEFEIEQSPTAPRPALKVSRAKQTFQNEQNLAQTEFDLAKDEISIMHVEDPAGFERALIESEFDTIDEGRIEETQDLQTD